MQLTVLIPFFNEEKTLKESTLRVISMLPKAKILLIDDNSNDNSKSIAIELESTYSQIQLLQNFKNLGKGSALNLSKDFIVTSHIVIHDADLEYFPEDIVEMYELAKLYPNDMIIGSRFIGKKNRKNVYRRTYFANKLMSLFFSIIFMKKISDIATCYKLIPSKFFKNVDFIENSFSIEIEMVAKFLKSKHNVHEVPISYSGRSYEEGKKIKPFDGLMYLINTIKYRIF
jgi:glycosyltransferase involved in cell wall biosynthesis